MSTAAATRAREEWVRPRPTARGYRNDALVAGALAVSAWLSSLLYLSAMDAPHAPPWGTAIWAVAIAGPLALRRRFPQPVALVVAAAFVIGQYAAVYEQLFANICLYVALYSVGAWGRNRMLAAAVRILIAAGMVLWLVGVLIYQAINPGNGPDVSHDGVFSQFMAIGMISIVINLLYFGAAYAFGNASYAAARQRESLEERTRELEAQREVSARQAVALERVRIARELHDVVAHHVSVMGLQAGAARRMLAKPASAPADPRVAESLAAVESNAREAVDELHRLLGALRHSDSGDPDGDADDTPASSSSSTRGLAQLDELIDEARSAGLPVSFTVIGDPRPVSAVVGLTAYRIVQESLTNVRKHAGPRATVDVRLRYLPTTVEVDVSDTGTGPTAAAAPRSAGLGHIGMRERVAAVNGTLEVGPKTRGGYRVRATIPVPEAESAGDRSDASGVAGVHGQRRPIDPPSTPHENQPTPPGIPPTPHEKQETT